MCELRCSPPCSFLLHYPICFWHSAAAVLCAKFLHSWMRLLLRLQADARGIHCLACTSKTSNCELKIWPAKPANLAVTFMTNSTSLSFRCPAPPPAQVILEVLADGALASLANVLVGAFVFPDLASSRLRHGLADTLQALGHSVSGYAGASGTYLVSSTESLGRRW